MKIAVTGHRPQKLGREWDGIGPVSDYVRSLMSDLLIQKSTDDQIQGISGMALGIDMIWAEVLISHGHPVIAAVPFKGQERVWSESAQKRYWGILNHPLVQTHYVSEGGYEPAKLQIRNQWMVDQCDLLLAFWDGSAGGTYNCITYARKRETAIIYFEPKP